MRNFFFLILLSLLFGFCAGGNIKIKVNPNLSGELLIFEKKVKNKTGGIFFGSGLTPESETELVIKERFYSFKNITQITPPGLRFYYFKEENDTLDQFMVVIDTSANSKLIEALNIKKENILEIEKHAKNRDDLMRFNTLSEHIQIELSLPHKIASVKFTEKREPGEWTARSDGNGKVVINIPLIAVWGNEHPVTEVMVTIKD